MFVGHYGVSFAAKRIAPAVSLATLFIAVQLLDVAWAFLVLLGVEKVRIVPGFTATNPFDLYYMPYTHGLLSALGWAVAAGLVYRLAAAGANRTGAMVVAGAVFSHWLLDLLVHGPDLPLYADRFKVGFGLWNHPVVAFLLEMALLFGGMWYYFRAGVSRRAAMLLFGLVMFAVQAFAFFGPPPPSDRVFALTALGWYGAFALVIGVLERRTRHAPASAPSR